MHASEPTSTLAAVRSGTGLEDVFLVAALCVFCALPFLLGDQPLSLTSVKETGITSPQGDSAKQLILLALYGVTAAALVPRLSAAVQRAIGWPLVALLGWIALSAVWSDMPGITFRRTVALCGTLTLGGYLASQCPPRRLVRLLSWVGVIVLSGSLLAGLFLPASGLDAEHRLRGLFAHKNSLAAFAAVALTCAADRLGAADGRRDGLAWATGILGLLALALTGSASPVPAVAIAVFVIVRVRRGRPEQRHVLTGRLCTTLCVGIVALPWLAPYIGHVALLFGRNTDFSGRTLVWRFALEFLQRSPLVGYGYASFWYGPAGILFVNYAHFPVPHAHNGALQFLLDCGTAGLVMYGIVLSKAIRGLGTILHSTARDTGAWLAGFVVLYLSANLAEAHLLEPNDLYSVLFAYAVVRIQLTRQN